MFSRRLFLTLYTCNNYPRAPKIPEPEVHSKKNHCNLTQLFRMFKLPIRLSSFQTKQKNLKNENSILGAFSCETLVSYDVIMQRMQRCPKPAARLFITLYSRYKVTFAEWPLWCFPLPTDITDTEHSRTLGPHGLHNHGIALWSTGYHPIRATFHPMRELIIRCAQLIKYDIRYAQLIKCDIRYAQLISYAHFMSCAHRMISCALLIIRCAQLISCAHRMISCAQLLVARNL